jgi:hypothetical protein
MHKKAIAALTCVLFSALFLYSFVVYAPAQQLTANCIPAYNSVSGGLTCASWSPKLLNGLTNSATAVKTASGVLGGFYCINPSAASAYIQFFDVATAAGVTVGTTVPKLSFGIPTLLVDGAGPTSVGIEFLAGIQVAATTTATGSSAPGVAVDCNVFYN